MKQYHISDFYKTVGSSIRKVRREKDLKAFDVANQLGISESAYTKIERGQTKIELERIYQLSQIFDKPYAIFVNVENAVNSALPGSLATVQSAMQNIDYKEITSELLNLIKEKDIQIKQLIEKLK